MTSYNQQNQGCGAANKILGAVSAPAPLSKYRDMTNL